MNTANIENIYELSPIQQGILFHSLYESESGAYFVQLSYGLRGMVNIAAFERAWQRVVAHHPPLRTSFHWQGIDKPLQVVHKKAQLSLEQLDWRGINPEEQQEKFQAFLPSDRQRGFNLSDESLLRLTLIRLGERHYHFVWSSHHIILDGWSGALVFKDFALLYEAFCRGEEIPLQSGDRFADYIAWLQQQDLSQAEAFWRQTLQGVTAPTPLTNLEVHSLSAQPEKYLEQSLKLSPATTTALKSLAKQHQLTLNTIVQGAWALLLSRYSGEDEVVYGVTVSGRPVDLPAAESMVGIFINTLPLRVKLDAGMLLVPWLGQLQGQLLEIRQYEYTPLVEIQGWSEIPRGLPLFESILVFENYPVDRALSDWQKNLEIETLSAVDRTNYPLTISVIPGSELEIRIACDRSRFDTATMTRMLGHFQTLLEGMAANPEMRHELPFLTTGEKHQLLVEWNQTQLEFPQQCIHQLFEAQVDKTPDAVAVVFADQSLTYQQLNQRANQLARYLQKLGVGAEVPVCICVNRSIEMVVGLLGILKAGGAYVPLDPTYPLERLEYIQQDVRSPVLLTQRQLTAQMSSQSAQVVCLDTDWEEIKQQTPENLATATKSNNLAYVIYTSGSTGLPKGVEIAHSNVVNFLSAMQQSVGLNQQDVLLAVTTLAFDIAALEIFLPLTIGARVVVASREVASDGVQLSDLLNNSQATVMQATPATWRILLSVGWQGSKHLKILCGGEALSRQLANQLLPQCHGLWNLYGPTETTIWSTVEQVEWGEDIVPIGRPIGNTYIYILDSNLQPTPIGVPGELYIGGAGVARGYWQRPELTTQRFIINPFLFQPDQRLYKTGDLVRYRSDGKIEYIGRLDYQVKIRGFRIELGEIEAVLAKHSDVQQVVVIAKQDSLIAYVVSCSRRTVTVSELRDFLKQKLPYYMVPQAFVFLDSLPLTPNGKVNRNALADADTPIANFNDAFVPPRNAIEEVLAGIWAKILGVELGIHDNFFDLGGHSLLATQVISRIRETFKVELPLRCLFESPSVAELSQRLIAHEAKPGMTAKIAQIVKQLEGMSAEEAKQALENRKAAKQVRA